MPANDYVRARIDPVIKNEAATVLAKMGLTVSDLCRMALTRVAHEKRLPFSDDIPNALTRETIERRNGERKYFTPRMRKTFSDSWGYKCVIPLLPLNFAVI